MSKKTPADLGKKCFFEHAPNYYIPMHIFYKKNYVKILYKIICELFLVDSNGTSATIRIMGKK